MDDKTRPRESHLMSADFDPKDAARLAQGLGDLGGHAVVLLGAAAAGVLRLASYSGPPRPWRAVALDMITQFLVAVFVGEVAIGIGAGPHMAMGLALGSAVVGWETVKRIAAKRARGEK